MNIGIFGGAFDPFHIEHRNVIIAAEEALKLDKLVVVPSFAPPHKKCEISPYEARKEMVIAGTKDFDYVVVDDIENQRGCVNPTSVTLPLLKEKYPADKFYFIMGGDSAINFPTWIAPEKIVACARLAIACRKGCGDFSAAIEFLQANYGADVTVLPYIGDWVSSSRIKALAELGYKLDGVSPEVEKIIEKYGLYRNFSSLITKLKTNIPEATFQHCASTAVYAESFAGVLKLKFEDVFIACMLHDCAKHIKTDYEGIPGPVVHQFTGSERARIEYGIEDDIILDAIRYHTSGKPEMSRLGKLVYCADMLEPRRNFPEVENLRTIIASDFEKGFVACVKASYNHLLTGNKPIYPLTKACLEYYN